MIYVELTKDNARICFFAIKLSGRSAHGTVPNLSALLSTSAQNFSCSFSKSPITVLSFTKLRKYCTFSAATSAAAVVALVVAPFANTKKESENNNSTNHKFNLYFYFNNAKLKLNIYIFLRVFTTTGKIRSAVLSHWTNTPENPLAIEIQASRQHHPDFWTVLLLPENRTLVPALRTERQPTKPFYPSRYIYIYMINLTAQNL